MDFLGKSGIIKKLFNRQLNLGQGAYDEYPAMGELQGCMASQSFIFESSDFFLSNSNRAYQQELATPESYKQDEIASRQVLVSPSPQVQGNQVTVAFGQGGYGVIAGVASSSDFTFTCDPLTPAGYGTIAGANGNPYLECVGPGFGVVGNMVPSTGNLEMMGTALPFNVGPITGNTWIELVPDSFVQYLKYGILARIFSSDSELKDTQKAAWCQARVVEGTNLAAAILCEVYQEEQP